MKFIESIRHILVEEIGSYRLLLELLQREKDSLLTLNAGDMEQISKEKDTIVLGLKLLEEERIRLMHQLSRDHMAAGVISLQGLSEITGDESFHVLRLQMISLRQGIMELNDFNRILIERSLNFVRNSLHLLEPISLKGDQKHTGILLSREV